MIKVKYKEFVAELEQRRSKLPREALDTRLQSTDKPRTESKKALLEKIEQGARRTGIDWKATRK